MALDTSLAKLLMEIETRRESAARARRLAASVANQAASENLIAYAKEIEAEVQGLEAQAAVTKQSATEIEQAAEPEQSIAALKPPSDPDPKA